MEKVRLVDICNPKQWKTIPTSELLDEGYPVYGANGIIGYYSEFNHENPVVAVTCRGATCGSINITVPQAYVTGNAMCLDDVRNDIEIEYLYYCLKHYNFNNVISGSAQPQITRQGMEKIVLSIFNHDEQVDIISKLKKTENVIGLRKQELAALDDLIKARFVEMFGDPIYNTNKLPIKRLNDLGEWASGGTPSRAISEYFEGDINWYSAGELNTLFLEKSLEKITEEAIEKSSTKLFKAGSMLVGMYDTAAFKMGILKEDSASNQACACITPNDRINIIWLYYELQLMKEYFLSQRRGVRQKNLNLAMIKGFEIPIANRDKQDEFVRFVNQVNKSKVAVQKALDEAQLLFDSLMQEYFG